MVFGRHSIQKHSFSRRPVDSPEEDTDDTEIRPKRYSIRSKLIQDGLAHRISTQNSSRKSSCFSYSVKSLNENIARRKLLLHQDAHKLRNRLLAKALNDQMVRNNEVSQILEATREENMALLRERSDLRKTIEDLSRTSGSVRASDALMEVEFQRRLVEYLDPIKKLMSSVLSHAHGLSENLTPAMQMIVAPSKRAKSSISSLGTTNGINTSRVSDFRGSKRRKTVAHVSPRVAGLAIHKPRISLPRIDHDQIRQLQGGTANGDQEREQVEMEGTEDEPLAPQSNSEGEENVASGPQRPRRQGPSNLSDIAENEEQTDYDVSMEQNRSPRVVLSDVMLTQRHRQSIQVQEHINHEEEVDSDNDSESHDHEEDDSEEPTRKTVLLLPKVVLERVVVSSPSKSRQSCGKSWRKTFVVKDSKQTEELPVEFMEQFHAGFKSASASPFHSPQGANPLSSTRFIEETPQQTAKGATPSTSGALEHEDETPRCREPTESFLHRLMDNDPMEGPSWLFGNSEQPNLSKRVSDKKNRAKRSSSIKLKAILGDCSKKLNLSTEDIKEEQATKRRTNVKSSAEAQPSTESSCVDETKQTKEKSKKGGGKRSRKETHAKDAVPDPDESDAETGSRMATPASSVKTAVSSKGKKSQVNVSPMDASLRNSTGRPKRRAANEASKHLGEPSLNKKMRQGDEHTDQFFDGKVTIPGTKKGKGRKK